jgi:pyruvate/2-oxoglutarate dehydrogenase complex dihydrolipoamide dehydrogenase (E3) component
MDWDTIIVGAGQAGSPLAARLAEHGRRVLLVERAHVGGTCVNTGCTPTKTMVASARAAHVARNARRLGVDAGAVTVDFPAVVARKDRVVAEWRAGSERRLERAGANLTLLRGHGRFVGERTLEVDGERHHAPTVVLDVGARTAVPPLPGLDRVPWLDNAGILELRELPAHLIVLGGGFVGCEFAQMFRRFGSEVTVIEAAAHLLQREDPEVSAALEEVFRGEGIALELGSRPREVFGSAAGIVLRLESGREIRGSHLLVATGRRPNTDELDCAAGGVQLDGRGYVVVDDLYRTSAQGVYAAGDVAGGPQFTHTAWDDHRLLFDMFVRGGTRGRAGRVIPSAVFTDPQVGRVGLSEREARERGIAYEAATLPFGHVARALEVDEPAGILKVLVDPASERILGAAIVGAEAGELIHVFAVLMQAGASARTIVAGEFAHPTFAEGLQTVVMRLERYRLS